MVLVDTSVWIDHLQRSDAVLEDLLLQERVVIHPFVIGELAVGRFSSREAVLHALERLPRSAIASNDQVLRFIEANALFGVGIGYIDAHLLASAKLNPGTSLLTRDRRLRTAAASLSLMAKVTH